MFQSNWKGNYQPTAICSARNVDVLLKDVANINSTISQPTQNLIKAKNIGQSRAQRTLDQSEKKEHLTEVRRLKQLIRENVTIDRNKNWTNLIRSANLNPRKFWQVTKLTRKRGTAIPSLMVGNVEAITHEEKAEALASQMALTHIMYNSPSTDFDITDVANHKLLSEDLSEDPENAVMEDDLLKIIDTSHNCKAPGLDGITNPMLQQLPMEAVELLTSIINQCAHWGHWSKPYRKAEIVPIRKPGKCTNLPSSYRPTSLLSSLGKTYERAFLLLIIKETDGSNILRSQQYGFREKHSAPQ